MISKSGSPNQLRMDGDEDRDAYYAFHWHDGNWSHDQLDATQSRLKTTSATLDILLSKNEMLRQRVEESNHRWNMFWKTFGSYESTMKLNGRHILPPVMTPEKRKDMQVYRKQASDRELRQKGSTGAASSVKKVAGNTRVNLSQAETSEGFESPEGASRGVPEAASLSPTLQEVSIQKSEGVQSAVLTKRQILSTEHKKCSQVLAIEHTDGSCSRALCDGSVEADSWKGSLSTKDSLDKDAAVTAKVTALDSARHRSLTNPDSCHTSDSDSEKLIIVKRGRIHRRRSSGSKEISSLEQHNITFSSRSGSGDIAVEGQHHASPLILTHRRGGSGDLATLRPKRESVSKQLTQSYENINSSKAPYIDSLADAAKTISLGIRTDSVDSADSITCSSAYKPSSLSAQRDPLVFTKYDNSKSTLLRVPSYGTATVKSPTGPPVPIKADHTLSQSPCTTAVWAHSVDQDAEVFAPFFPEYQRDASSPCSMDSLEPKELSGSSVCESHQKGQVDAYCLPYKSSMPLAIPASSPAKGQSSVPLPISSLQTSSTQRLLPASLPTTQTHLLHVDTKTQFYSPGSLNSCQAMGQDSPVDFMDLPSHLSATKEHLATQQWLVHTVSEISSCKDSKLGNWLHRPVPDGVKQQKQNFFMPFNASPKNNLEIHVPEPRSPSPDDTLDSSSPIHEEETSISQAPCSFLVQPVSTKMGRGLVRSNSYTLDSPSAALLAALPAACDGSQPIKMNSSQKSSTKFNCEVVPHPEKSDSLPLVHAKAENKRTGDIHDRQILPSAQKKVLNSSVTPSHKAVISPAGSSASPIERSRTVSSKSYILERPSAALVDSLLESHKATVESQNGCAEVNAQYKQAANGTATPPAVDKALSANSSDNVSGKDSAVTSDPLLYSRRSVQRKLEYSFPDHDGSVVEVVKESNLSDPRHERVRRYLLQMGSAERPEEPTISSNQPPASPERSDKRLESAVENSSSKSPSYDGPSSRHVSPQEITKQTVKQTSQTVKHQVQVRPPTDNKFVSTAESSLFQQVRQELTLLKAKYASRLRDGSERPGSAEPAISRQILDHVERPNTAMGYMSPFTHKHVKYQQPFNYHTSPIARNALENSPPSGSNKGVNTIVKTYAEKEEMPIASTYLKQSELDHSLCDELGSYGGIYSISRPTTAGSVISEEITPQIKHTYPVSGVYPDSFSHEGQWEDHAYEQKAPSSKLAAVVRGHLCRKLLACSKVQSIVKTIKDCQNLLTVYAKHRYPSRVSVTSLQDTHIQENLILAQMQAACLELHKVFFELPTRTKIAMIQQSELHDAQNRVKTKHAVQKRPIHKENVIKKKMSLVTQKVAERKKVQQAVNGVSKSSTITLKKSVLVPTYAASSPKRAPTVSG